MPVLYVSRAEFKDRVGIDDEGRDYAIDRVLDGASRWVENVLGRRFYTTDSDETRYYTASECFWQLRPDDDILSVTSLQTDANGDTIFDTTWATPTDYYLGPVNSLVNGKPYTEINKTWWTGRFSFPAYDNAVKVIGKFGYCTIDNCPAGIRELTMMVAQVDGQELLDLSMPGVQNYKLGNELSVTVSGKNLPRFATTIIDQYRRGNRYVH